MSNHTHNWSVRYTTSEQGRSITLVGVVYGRTREDARRKAIAMQVDAPHGVRVRTTSPVKFLIK